MNIVIVNRQDSDIRATYNAEMVDHISNDKAKDLYSASDIGGNGYKPNDMLMTIYFKNGDFGSFGAKDWFITFEA